MTEYNDPHFELMTDAQERRECENTLRQIKAFLADMPERPIGAISLIVSFQDGDDAEMFGAGAVVPVLAQALKELLEFKR